MQLYGLHALLDQRSFACSHSRVNRAPSGDIVRGSVPRPSAIEEFTVIELPAAGLNVG